MRFKRVPVHLIWMLLPLMWYGCSPALYQPIPAQATQDVSFDQLVEGRNLYVNKCGSCHSLHLPHQYSKEVWFHNLDEMQERAKISDQDKKLIADYLMAGIQKTKSGN